MLSRIAPSRFELLSRDPKSLMLDRYTMGLSLFIIKNAEDGSFKASLARLDMFEPTYPEGNGIFERKRQALRRSNPAHLASNAMYQVVPPRHITKRFLDVYKFC